MPFVAPGQGEGWLRFGNALRSHVAVRQDPSAYKRAAARTLSAFSGG